jgi:outer membrane protein
MVLDSPVCKKHRIVLRLQKNNQEKSVSYLSNLRVAALGLACLLATAAIDAQGPPAAPGPAEKIGVINIQQAISATAEGKQAAVELEAKFASREQELDSLNKQVNDIRQRLSGGASLADDERQRLNAQGTRLAQRLERKNSEFQEDLNAAQVERVNEIGHKMVAVITRYATDGGFTAILDSSAQNSPVLFAAKNADVTQDVVRLYDQANPAKLASAPATPKPVAAPSPKPQ